MGHAYTLPDIKESTNDKLDLPDLLDTDEISSKNDEAEQKLEGTAKFMGVKQKISKQHCKPKLLF